MIKEFAEFLRIVLPKDKSNQQVHPNIELSEQTSSEQTPQQLFEVPSTSETEDVIYGGIASPFLSPNTRLHDTQYGIR